MQNRNFSFKLSNARILTAAVAREEESRNKRFLVIVRWSKKFENSASYRVATRRFPPYHVRSQTSRVALGRSRTLLGVFDGSALCWAVSLANGSSRRFSGRARPRGIIDGSGTAQRCLTSGRTAVVKKHVFFFSATERPLNSRPPAAWAY